MIFSIYEIECWIKIKQDLDKFFLDINKFLEKKTKAGNEINQNISLGLFT